MWDYWTYQNNNYVIYIKIFNKTLTNYTLCYTIIFIKIMRQIMKNKIKIEIFQKSNELYIKFYKKKEIQIFSSKH